MNIWWGFTTFSGVEKARKNFDTKIEKYSMLILRLQQFFLDIRQLDLFKIIPTSDTDFFFFSNISSRKIYFWCGLDKNSQNSKRLMVDILFIPTHIEKLKNFIVHQKNIVRFSFHHLKIEWNPANKSRWRSKKP